MPAASLTQDLRDRLIREHRSWATQRYEYDALGPSAGPPGTQRSSPVAAAPVPLRCHGNLAAIEDSRKGNRSFHYDPLDRLVAVRGDLPESFAHDPAGTLLAQNGIAPTGLANVKGNRLLMQGDCHYDYDAFGNLVRERRGAGQRLVTEYRYDSQHRLIAASLPDGRQVQYRYDAFGRRIAKTVDGQTTEFLWQGERLIAESGPAHYRSYIYEPGTFRPLALLQGEREATEPFYYQLDHLGTPQELTSAGGQILWSVKYRAYGSLAKVEVAEIDNPLRFQGQYFDAETGLHYNRHRYYNPGTGSFLTPDPIKLAGGLNNYQYVPNPTGWVDPLGLNRVPGQCPDGENKSVFERYPEKTVIQTKGADEQAKFLSENVPGLPEAQAKIILEESHSRDSSAVFGGSRVRGNHTDSSDLDVGFGGLNANQAAKLLKKLEKRFSLELNFLKLEQTRIVPGNETNSIARIQSPEEFFQRSGTRGAADPKAGEPYVPSGSITANPDGSLVIIPPGAEP